MQLTGPIVAIGPELTSFLLLFVQTNRGCKDWTVMSYPDRTVLKVLHDIMCKILVAFLESEK